jgi:uncharacterized phage infection (PIP) family protein YhgE
MLPRHAPLRGGPVAYADRGATANNESGEVVVTNRTLASGIVLLAIALAGCGGSSGPSLSSFKSGFAKDKTEFRKLGADLQTALTQAGSKTDAQLATELGTLSTRAKQQASQLSKLNPPAKFKTNLNTLVSSLKSIGGGLSQIATAATKHDAKTARALTTSLVQNASKVKSSETALTKGLGLPATS